MSCCNEIGTQTLSRVLDGQLCDVHMRAGKQNGRSADPAINLPTPILQFDPSDPIITPAIAVACTAAGFVAMVASDPTYISRNAVLFVPPTPDVTTLLG